MWGFIPLFLYKCISVFLEKHQWKSSRSCVKFFFYRPGFAWQVYRLIYLKLVYWYIILIASLHQCGLKFKSFSLVWEIREGARGSYNILVLELEHHVIGWLIYNFIYSIFQYFGLFGTCHLTVLYFRVFDTPPLWDWIGFIKEDSWGVSPYLFTNIILQCWADNTLF
jgi:hypothetical protein